MDVSGRERVPLRILSQQSTELAVVCWCRDDLSLQCLSDLLKLVEQLILPENSEGCDPKIKRSWVMQQQSIKAGLNGSKDMNPQSIETFDFNR